MQIWEAEQKLKAIRKEAKRRMMVKLGARDAQHLDVIISNNLRQSVRLLLKDKINWTGTDMVEMVELKAQDEAIEDIRAASNILEKSRKIPADFKDAKYWPLNTPPRDSR